MANTTQCIGKVIAEFGLRKRGKLLKNVAVLAAASTESFGQAFAATNASAE